MQQNMKVKYTKKIMNYFITKIHATKNVTN